MNPVTNEKAPAAANSTRPEDRNESAIVPTTQQDRKLLPLRPENIPAALSEQPHWCIWRAIWNSEGHGGKGKWDKVPVHPQGYGLSTAKPHKWVPLALALAAYQASPKRFAGVGLLMRLESGVVGIDLDHCVDGNKIAPWALELLDKASTYTELSPSGTGLRLFVKGTIAFDWNNPEVGIEVYAGHTARFLTVTGQRLKKRPETVNDAPAGFLEDLASRYSTKKAQDASTAPQDMPDLVDELAMPDLVALGLSDGTRKALDDGDLGDDRSRTLFTVAVELCAAGLDDAEVLTVLASNEYTMGVALDHRRQDPDRAMDYLWREHVAKARQKAESRVATAADFEDVSGQAEPGGVEKVHPWAQFIDIASRPRAPRFIIPGFIQEGVVVLSGEPGIGKTTALVPLAMIAAGLHRGDEPLAPEHWRHVCYITEDDDQVHRIVHALAEFAGWAADVQAVAERLHVAPARRMAPADAVKVGKLFRAQFTRTVAGVDIPPLVVVDTKAAALALENENDNAEVSAAVAAFKQQFAGLPTWLVGHTAKTSWGQADASKLSSRGGGAWGADAHQQLFLVEENGQRQLQRGKTRFEAQWPALEVQASVAEIETLDVFGKMRRASVRWGVPVPVKGEDSARGKVGSQQSLRALVDAISVLEGLGEELPAAEKGSSTANSVLEAHGYFKTRKSAEVHAMLRDAERSCLVEKHNTKTPQRKDKEVWRLTDAGRALTMGAPNDFTTTP